jgi:AraC-like DNA-binding protein
LSFISIDKKTLQKAVRRLTGQTIHRYVRSRRMEKALSLVEEGKLRNDEIAAAVGYWSKANFYRAFADTFGCTPGELRGM